MGGLVLAFGVVAFVLMRSGGEPATPQATPATVQATMDVTVSGTGAVLVDGEACAAPCSVSRDVGSRVTVTVDDPTFPQVFEGWSGECSGIGDCVVTLAADTSVTAAFDEAPVSPEDCLAYNRTGLDIRPEGSRFLLTDGVSRMLILDTAADAQAALAVAQASSAQCFVGRPDPELTYWRPLGTGAPAVADPDCVAHDRNELRLVGEGSRWRLLDGPNHLMATFSSEADAGRGMVVAMEHDQRCFVGRSSPPAETSYWLP